MTQTATMHFAKIRDSLLLVMTLEPEEVGKRIKRARNAKGWSQLELALQIGKSPSAIYRWEKGELPAVRDLMRLADLLDVPAGDLVEQDLPIDPGQLDRIEADLRAVLSLLRGLSAD